MKLSELIAFRNRLNEFTVLSAKSDAKYNLDIVMHHVENPLEDSLTPVVQPFLNNLQTRQAEIYQAFDNLSTEVEKVKQAIQDQIAEHEKHWFRESYKLFEEAEDCEKSDHILNIRRSPKSERTLDAEEILRAKILNYADWRFPGMIIRPGLDDFINDMVGYDPLYIVDRDYDLLRPSLTQFPKLYQTRLRTYTTNDWGNDPILEKIPSEQFGICLANNVFNYRPLEIIRKYLTEIYTKLRPGGVLLMTYNDCDRANAVMLVERYANSYTPGYLIRDLAKNIGFEQISTWDDGGPSVWLELRKPGELIGNRGGQVIANIKELDWINDDVDFVLRRHYNKEEVVVMHERARVLEIDESIIQSTVPGELQLLIFKKDAERQAKLRLEYLHKTAQRFNVNTNNPDWENHVEALLVEEHNLELKEAEQRRINSLKVIALENNIDITQPNWVTAVEEFIHKKDEDQRRHEEELNRQRIQELHNRARSLGIDPLEYPNESEILRRISEEDDKRKKQELVLLRQRAMELQAGDPNLIRYGYSAEKLRQLIKEKENK